MDDDEKYRYGKKYKTHLEHEKIAEDKNFSAIERMGIFNGCKRALVVGCPNVFFITNCKAKGMDAFGLDLDPDVVDGKSVIRCDVEKERFPFQDGEFDVVYSKGLIQHLEKPPINFMREIKRVTRPGGYVVMLVRNEKSIANILGIWDNYKHKSTWTPMSIKRMFEDFGIKVVYMSPRFNFISGHRLLSHLPCKWSLGSTIFVVGMRE